MSPEILFTLWILLNPPFSAVKIDVAEGEGFEPPVGLPQRLISSQVPLTTQPPFRPMQSKYSARICVSGKRIRERWGETKFTSFRVLIATDSGLSRLGAV